MDSIAKRAQAASDRRAKEEADRLKKIALKRVEAARLKLIERNAGKRNIERGEYGEIEEGNPAPVKKPKSNPVVVSQAKRAQAASDIRVEKEADRLKKLKLKTDAKEASDKRAKKEEARVKRAKEVASDKRSKEEEARVKRAEEVYLAERRLKAGKYGEIEEGNPAPFKKPKSESKLDPGTKSGVLDMPPPALIVNPKLANATVPTKKPPRTIGIAAVDKFKSVPQSLQEEETEKRSSVTAAKKKRDRLFGLDFLPEIDSKEGEDKINLPFGLGSYKTLPQKEDTSKNKKGGSIAKRKVGGKIRKAGCKRGMGKAMRGY